VTTLDEVLVHQPPMRLLDRIVEVSENAIVAEAIVRADNPFFEAGHGLPAYIGLEMMAQAIAAIDGYKRHVDGEPAKIGFLLGCRRYAPSKAFLEEDARLRISAAMVFHDNAMFAFDCSIEQGGAELATANLKVYAPADPAAFLGGQPAA
jgi:predicted hotdog family 3-hydroxylacyl-ACP dehydratase